VHWKNSRSSTLTAVLPEEADEITEVFGAHMKRYKISMIKQVQLMKDIFKCKQTRYEAANPDHIKLLTR
jgi:hypothetical protein